MNVTRSSASRPRPTRRDFLKLVTTAVLSATGVIVGAGLFRFLDFESEPIPQTDFDLGPASSFPVGSRTMEPDVPALIINAPEGFKAISLVCTHLGCTVEPSTEGFSCPCHGSRYDGQGNVVRGPAMQALRRLRAEVNGSGHLVVHTD